MIQLTAVGKLGFEFSLRESKKRKTDEQSCPQHFSLKTLYFHLDFWTTFKNPKRVNWFPEKATSDFDKGFNLKWKLWSQTRLNQLAPTKGFEVRSNTKFGDAFLLTGMCFYWQSCYCILSPSQQTNSWKLEAEEPDFSCVEVTEDRLRNQCFSWTSVKSTGQANVILQYEQFNCTAYIHACHATILYT